MMCLMEAVIQYSEKAHCVFSLICSDLMLIFPNVLQLPSFAERKRLNLQKFCQEVSVQSDEHFSTSSIETFCANAIHFRSPQKPTS